MTLCGRIIKLNKYRGVEQLVARRAHNPEVIGSNPFPATTKLSDLGLGVFFFYILSLLG